MRLQGYYECPFFVYMNSTAHKIPLVIQAIGYVAFTLSTDQQVVKRPYITFVYEDCTCPPHVQPMQLNASAQEPDCSGGDGNPWEELFRYPIGIVSDELENTGGHPYG